MENEIEIFDYVETPKRRDPKARPFIVEQSLFQRHKANGGSYRVMGTFRSGIVSLLAVPSMNFRGSSRYAPWTQWLKKEDAIRWAQHLNKLHADGHIDWSGQTPAIIPPVDRQPVKTA